MSQKLPFDPLRSLNDMAGLISEVTATPQNQVIKRLEQEQQNIGTSVKTAFNKAIQNDGAERYVYNEAMERFYSSTDSFLYELAIWNLNGLKQDLGKWCCDWITEKLGQSKVLSIGDGMGFECQRLNQSGHKVTYFEVPGHTAQFAKKLFQRNSPDIQHLTDPREIPSGTFDALICLDVLEHVPAPSSFVEMLKAHLKPGGIFISHAPFYMIQANYPTHVAASRKFSGTASLYKKAGFRVIDGRPLWNPIVLQAPGGNQLPSSILGKTRLAIGKPYLRLGRKSTKPFHFIHNIKNKHQTWF